MNPFFRLLEDWSTHQDYFWFLAALAWAGVIGAEFRRKEQGGRTTANGWLMALALSQIAGAMLELVLLAQDITVPYTKFDLAMGAAQAGGAAALAWGATTGVRLPALQRGVAIGVLAAHSVARFWWPVEAGFGICVLQAIAVLGLLLRRPRPISSAAGVLLMVAPIVATHGPWAYAIDHGRRMTDWSHFSLFAAGTILAAGALLAAAAWQRRLREAVPEAAPGSALRRDLRRALLALAGWLTCGMLLAVWYGRQARSAYEDNLLRRVEIAAFALDADTVAEALGPELRIESIERKYYPSGRSVDVATVPRTQTPAHVALLARMEQLRQRNPDFDLFYVAVWRQGHLLLLNSKPKTPDDITRVIHHDVTPEDLIRMADRRSFIEGPVVLPTLGAKLSAKAPLLHPKTGQLLGWLVADVDATRWAATFTQARLQTMALVAAGVGLWALAVAYRLRRESRDAAEQKAAAAAAADRTKSAFLAKVSHELRTPIQSVLGYGELLEEAPLSEQHRSWLAALRSHGDMMLRLVNDLIDLGGLQSGAFQLEIAPVGLAALIDECAASLQPAVAAKGLAFEIEMDPGVPSWVRADGVRLRQVLLNLLNNAVKYTPNGRVSLRVRSIEMGRIEFAVADSGPGIPATLRPRLFQPFARLDPAASEGSGLGLALVKGLCDVMNGEVCLAENSGPGATFVARLPLPRCETPVTGLARVTAATPSFGGFRVLVAEDNTLVRELLSAFLVRNGAEVALAADGPTALRLARERKPDVLLLDIALPGLDGIAVAEALRQDGPVSYRIIGLSAHAGPQDEARARSAGMDVFLTKPVSLARLAEAIVGQPRVRITDPVVAPAARIADERLRAQLISQFTNETPRLLAEMRSALAAADWPRLRRSAHYLKNSADVLGAKLLQETCQRLASLGDRPEPAAARQLLEAVVGSIPSRYLGLADSPPADRN